MSVCAKAGCNRFVGVHTYCWEHKVSKPPRTGVFDLVEREWSPAEQTAEADALRTLRAPVIVNPLMRAPGEPGDGVCFHGFRSYLDCGECLNAADLDVGFGAHR